MMNLQQIRGNGLIDKRQAPIKADEYFLAVEEFDDLWSAGKSEASRRRMDELMALMQRYESQLPSHN